MNNFLNKYPVFEAEQVLSHKELNNIVSFLESQDRADRVALFGVGIVNGLNIKLHTNNQITIECGTAITSLGYLIQWETTTFSHYQTKPIAESFYAANYSEEPFLESNLEKAKLYEVWKNSHLLTNDSQNGNNLLQAAMLDDCLIVLALEAQLIDQKNCITTNCDDKGKRLEFNICPRLIPKQMWDSQLLKPNTAVPNIVPIPKKRFNIPPNSIIDADDIFNAFKAMHDGNYVKMIQQNIISIFDNIRYQIPINDAEIIKQDLINLEKRYNALTSKLVFQLQHQQIADWLMDIIEAYNELITLPYMANYYNCKPINHFPFHIVLGSFDTNSNLFRTPFYKKNIDADNKACDIQNLIMLIKRLCLLINNFNPTIKGIKITPSYLGAYNLSNKSIPYYYNNILEIKENWMIRQPNSIVNYEPLSYHSQLNNYSTNPAIINPLEYGIDQYNFFRIEGIIGTPYRNALEELNLLKNAYHLPFEIIAVNAANLEGKEMSLEHFNSRWEDLETDYDIARKRIFNIAEFVIKWIQKNKSSFSDNGILLSEQQIIHLEEMLDEMNSLLTEDLMEFIDNYEDFATVFTSMNELFLYHKACIQKVTKAFNIIAEDLIDRMDDINELFLENPFDILYTAAMDRWNALYKQYFFEHFYSRNPGLDHQNGVSVGGTYVVVYLDNSVFKKKIKLGKIAIDNLLKKLDNYKVQFNFKEEEKLAIKNNLKTTKFILKKKQTPLETIKDCSEQTDKIKAELLLHIKEKIKGNYSLHIQQFILDKIQDAIKLPIGIRPTNTNYENLVLADFYLPYICHNAGPLLYINIPAQKIITIALAKTTYCANDNTGYLIDTNNNVEGIFIGESAIAITLLNNQWIFTPNKLAKNNNNLHTIQYRVDDISSNIININMQDPEAILWTATEVSTNLYEFKNKGNTSFNYEFDFDDGKGKELINTNTFTRDFNFSNNKNSFKIIINHNDGICFNQQTIIIGKADFDQKDFNNKDFYTPKN